MMLNAFNGGYKEKYFSFGEEEESPTDKESKDCKQSQENKDKQILDIYFSYGSNKSRLNDASRHSSDVNLHLKTQGYEDGEEVRVELEFSRGNAIVSSIIHNNQAIIMNILKEYEG